MIANDNIKITPIYKRIVSFIFDFIAIYLISFLSNIVKYKLKGINLIYAFEGMEQIYISYIGFIYFFVCFYCLKGQTLADKFIKIKVIKVDRSNINLFQSFLRAIFLSSFLFVFETRLVILIYQLTLIVLSIITLSNNPWKKYKQTIWDTATGTIMVGI